MNRKERGRRQCLGAIVLGAGLLISCTPRVQPGALPSSTLQAEEIRISRGACFGFCPVYTVSVTPAGRVDFTGERHTQVLGQRARSVGREGYEALRQALASVRPKDEGTHALACDAPTDVAQVTLAWVAPGGGQRTLSYPSTCRKPEGEALGRAVETQMKLLGVDAWAAQKTWPGATRG